MPYQTAKEQERRQREIDAGLISQWFPGVDCIRLEVEFQDSSGKRVQFRCRNFSPDSSAIFEMKCPLDHAPFDLKSEVSTMLSSRTPEQNGKVKCDGRHNDSEHEIFYKITLDFANAI